MRFRLERRTGQPWWFGAAPPLLAALLTALTGFILFAALGYDPLRALSVFFVESVDSWIELGDLAMKTTPLLLCALGLAIGFRGNVWNIGAEGQLVAGGIAAGAAALALPEVGAWIAVPVVFVAGLAGGAAWAAIPAVLRTRFNANEILTSLMLTYVAILLLGYLVHGPMRSPTAFNFPVSSDLPDAARLPVLLPALDLHLGALLALATVPVFWLFTVRSHLGFQVTVAGLAPKAADYAGFGGARIVWVGLLAGGAMAGLAGAVEVAGPLGKLQNPLSPGYGFAAIIVAFLGRLHPIGILLASLLTALLYLGGGNAQIALKLSPAITGVFQGLLLFYLLGADALLRYRIRLARPAGEAG